MRLLTTTAFLLAAVSLPAASLVPSKSSIREGVRATPAIGHATVEWDPMPAGLVCRVEWRKAAEKDWHTNPAPISGASITLSNLPIRTNLAVRVRAEDAYGQTSEWSNAVTGLASYVKVIIPPRTNLTLKLKPPLLTSTDLRRWTPQMDTVVPLTGPRRFYRQTRWSTNLFVWPAVPGAEYYDLRLSEGGGWDDAPYRGVLSWPCACEVRMLFAGATYRARVSAWLPDENRWTAPLDLGEFVAP